MPNAVESITIVKSDLIFEPAGRTGSVEVLAKGPVTVELQSDWCSASVNGNVVSIPSYSLKEGDIVSVRERSKSLEIITDSLASRANNYSWLEWDGAAMTGKFLNYPQRADIPENINEQLIVELYSK